MTVACTEVEKTCISRKFYSCKKKILFLPLTVFVTPNYVWKHSRYMGNHVHLPEDAEAIPTSSDLTVKLRQHDTKHAKRQGKETKKTTEIF